MAKNHTIDRVGGWLSLICAIHCAVIPVLVLLAGLGAPVVDELAGFDDERLEIGFSVAAAVFVVASVGLGWRHGAIRRSLLIGFGVGLALLAAARLTPDPEWLAHLLLIGGALTLAYTHRQSLRSRAGCPEPPTPAALLP
jgi:hypothetical protein